MNNRLGKTGRTVAQAGTFLLVMIAGIIAFSGIANAYYYQPDNVFSSLLPGLSDALMNVWELGIVIVLLLQSIILLIIGLVYLHRNWLSLKRGAATFTAQLTGMLIVIGLFLTVVLLLFRASSLAGGSSPVGFFVPLTIVLAGLVQTALAMMVFGPHYNMIWKKK
mgnify:CR=1 FL=1